MSSNPDQPMTVTLSPASVQALADAMQSPDAGSHNFTRLVAPFLAGFTFATIAQLATSTSLKQPWRDLALAFFVIAAGMLLGGFQLSIGSLYKPESWRRPILAFGGLLALMGGIIVLIIFSVPAVTAWVLVGLALAVLFACVLVPIVLRIWTNIKNRTPMDLIRAW